MVNTAGAVKNSGGSAGCGGLIRNDTGRWICGFTKNLGATSAYIAKLWGMYIGLSIAEAKGANKIELQTDSLVVAHTLKESHIGSAAGCKIITEIQRPMQEFCQVHITHIQGS